ncbi:MAG: TonB-dependent receptor [Gemmatimonadota bacterium]|nr:TonB-dependent receptor [Gemmatimonadota bacterium]
MLFTLLTLAAQQATVTGVVRDSATLEPIAFAEVAVSPAGAAGRTAAGLSDRFGAFVIPNAPAGPVRVEANAFGYSGWARRAEEIPAGPLEILLAPAPIALDPLGVEAAGRMGDPISVSRDAFVADPAMIRAVPAVLETDVLRAMAVSPSASAPSDFVSVPYVRGGASEGTPVLLDGVRLFNPFHLGGFFSAVNPEAVDHAALLPGSGAGSQHVGSLSGAIEIATWDGSRDGHRVTGAVGLASSRLAVEGPVGGGTSYLVNGRHTYVYLLAKAMGGGFPYSFSDAHAKITHDFGGFRRLSVTGYVNSEGMEYDSDWHGTTDFGWGSSTVAAHYRDRLAGGAVLDVTIGHSRFGNDLFEFNPDWRDPVVGDTSVSGGGHMREDRVDVRAAWHLSRGTLAAGAQAIRLEGDHHYSRSDAGDFASLFIPVPLALRSRQWRIGAFANVDAGRRAGGPLRRAGEHLRSIRGNELRGPVVGGAGRSGALPPGDGLAAERGGLGCDPARLRSPRARQERSRAAQHRGHRRMGGIEGRLAPAAGRIREEDGEHSAARAGRRSDPGGGAGGPLAPGGRRRVGSGDRGVVQLGSRPRIRGGRLPLGPGLENGRGDDLRAPLSPGPRAGARRRSGDRKVQLVGAVLGAVGTAVHSGAGGRPRRRS